MFKKGLILGLILFLAGCAVVNVYVTFPQEKIDKAMEELELQVQPGDSSPKALQEQSRLNNLWRFFKPSPLYADTVVTSEVKITSSDIEEAKNRRVKRLPDIQKYKNKKVIGENNKGLLEIRSTEGLDKEEVFSLRKTVQEENNDRMAIYRNIVEINNMVPSEITRVQASAAKANRKLAKEGEWIQDEKGVWQTKKSEK